MKIKQISVAIENSKGRLYEITKALGDAGVNIRALNLVDTVDFGTVRLLVSDVATSRRVLMEMHMPAHMDEVIAVELADTPGSLAEFLKILFENGASVGHMYAIVGSVSGKAIMIFHFGDNEKAIKVIQENGISLLTTEELGIYETSS